MTKMLQIALELALQLASDAYPDSRVDVIDVQPCSEVLPDDMIDSANDTVCATIYESCYVGDPCYGTATYHVVEVDLSTGNAIAGYDAAFSVEWTG